MQWVLKQNIHNEGWVNKRVYIQYPQKNKNKNKKSTII